MRPPYGALRDALRLTLHILAARAMGWGGSHRSSRSCCPGVSGATSWPHARRPASAGSAALERSPHSSSTGLYRGRGASRVASADALLSTTLWGWSPSFSVSKARAARRERGVGAWGAAWAPRRFPRRRRAFAAGTASRAEAIGGSTGQMAAASLLLA